ncbi:MAG: phosphoribosyl-AMP cyclohydrolase [Bacteroidetes bacterium QS_8_68_15]|nr:MAG: phosphoribosyl-AMP cyclohydrolase [Bacteroidetes bacterium QS_8_68_15]
MNALLDEVTYDDDGLVTAIAQDAATDDVLMLAYMTEDTLRRTLDTERMTYWSRSRQEVWVKGQSSGNTQHVREVRLDCDGDALVFKVDQKGDAACHTGHRSCFYREYTGNGEEGGTLEDTGEQVFDPAEVYG